MCFSNLFEVFVLREDRRHEKDPDMQRLKELLNVDDAIFIRVDIVPKRTQVINKIHMAPFRLTRSLRLAI